jgi:ubiquinone biosynthesis protein COQ9
MPKNKNDLEKKCALAALCLTAAQGWENVTFDRIARTAKIPVATVKKHFAAKNDILSAIVRNVTEEVAVNLGKPDRHASPRDRLFEVLMARFDVLQKYRTAILNIMSESRRDSAMLCALLPAQSQAMRHILKLAGFERYQFPQQKTVTLGGVGLVYLATMRVWQKDETLDMAKTMAALDRYLRLADKAAAILFRKN